MIAPGINKPRPNGRRRCIDIFQIVISLQHWLMTLTDNLHVMLLLVGTTSGWIRGFLTMSCQWMVSAWHRNLLRSTYTPPFKISVKTREEIKDRVSVWEKVISTLSFFIFNWVSITSLEVLFQDLIFQEILISHEGRWGARGQGEQVTLG